LSSSRVARASNYFILAFFKKPKNDTRESFMNTSRTFPSLGLGLALFSMFFGAGNIVFPLAVGQSAGDKTFFATLGLILTAAIVPIAGVIAMILYDGSQRLFFGRLGRIPGFLLSLAIISLLGPLGSTPRCIALAYSTLKGSFLEMGPVLFSAITCALIFACTVKKRYILPILGWILTPVLLASLIAIIAIGLFSPSHIQHVEKSSLDMFVHGLKEGYNTMDLLAAFFFSSAMVYDLRSREDKNTFPTALRASLIGALLLALVYAGFSALASFHAAEMHDLQKDALLAAITMRIAGPIGGALVCIAIALACFTTAIALISAFTDFVHKEIFGEKKSYRMILIGALGLTFFVSIFEFNQISAFLGPILQICYPGLIVLTFVNIAHRLKAFRSVKVPVFGFFALSAGYYFLG
jgi:branched-chain amino acid:cation transporter, LIVCS family